MSHEQAALHCQNCNAVLNGPYCSACGQKTGDLHRPAWEIVEDFLHSAVHFDSRLWRTLRSLFLRPGEMTTDWVDGRQARYVPPIRLFIFTSLILVTLLNLSDVTLLRLVPFTSASTAEAPDSVHLNLRLEVLTVAPAVRASGPPVTGDLLRSVLNDAEDADEYRLMERMVEGINALALNPRLANEIIGKSLSRFMLLAVPLMAALLWSLYRRRFLAEHVVFALNTHTFFFIGLLIAVLLAWISRSLINGKLLLTILWAGYSLHFLVALKRVYRNGWIVTFIKSAAITLCYMGVLLSIGTHLLMGFPGS